MEFSLIENGNQLCISNNGVETYWNFSMYLPKKINAKKGYFGFGNDIFYFVNTYINTLPEKTHNDIFGIYKNIDFLIQRHGSNYDQITLALLQLSTNLFKLIDYDDLLNWVNNNREIKKLDSIRIDFDKESDDYVKGYETKTYLWRDYLELIALCIELKFMLPIWGFYIKLTSSEKDNKWKLFNSFKLLNQTKLVDQAPYHKLESYINETVNSSNDSITLSCLYNGKSLGNYIQWISSDIVVRKLPVIDISGENEKNNIISTIYTSVRSAISKTYSSSSSVTPKIFSNQSDDTADKYSKFEESPTRQEISTGSKVLLTMSLEDPFALLTTRDNTIPTNLLTMFLNTLKPLHDRPVDDVQIKLTQLILGDKIIYKGIHYVNKLCVINCLAVACTYLWHHNFKMLCAILCSYSNVINNDNIIAIGPSNRSRLTNAVITKLNTLFPYTKEKSPRTTLEIPNYIITYIASLEKEIAMLDLITLLPKEFCNELNIASGLSLQIPIDLKYKIAELVIYVTENK